MMIIIIIIIIIMIEGSGLEHLSSGEPELQKSA